MANTGKIYVEVETVGIDEAKQKILELKENILQLKKLGLKNKTINLIVKNICVKENDEQE